MGGLRFGFAAAALAAIVALVPAAPAIAGEEDGGASTGTPRLSVSDRLDDRRYVAAGTRAYDIGTEAGRYPAMGFHTRGEMGGIWTPPLKLLDGIWFGVDGQWLPPASQFDSGYGYVRMAIPGQSGMNVSRVDFVPDGRRAVQVGLQFTAT
ncbi:MAG: glycogen debranching protein, partial [Candidatus Dormibacteraeota bacterium]|nr:glycogen debranching protein [Candidatus Dormibacteraeota bacterium]